MSLIILDVAIWIAQVMLGVAMALCLFRVIKGPRAQDRVVGLDAFYVVGMLLLVTLGMRTGSSLYFEASIIIALLGFVSTMAFAKFLMRGEVIE